MDSGARGAVWTDLPGNFSDRVGQAFSLDAAVAYLKTLDGDSLEEAIRYIENAPAQTNTPLRRRLQTSEWWQALFRTVNL